MELLNKKSEVYMLNALEDFQFSKKMDDLTKFEIKNFYYKDIVILLNRYIQNARDELNYKTSEIEETFDLFQTASIERDDFFITNPISEAWDISNHSLMCGVVASYKEELKYQRKEILEIESHLETLNLFLNEVVNIEKEEIYKNIKKEYDSYAKEIYPAKRRRM